MKGPDEDPTLDLRHRPPTQLPSDHGLPGRLLAIRTCNDPANSETPQGRKGQDSRGTCPGFSDEDGAAAASRAPIPAHSHVSGHITQAGMSVTRKGSEVVFRGRRAHL